MDCTLIACLFAQSASCMPHMSFCGGGTLYSQEQYEVDVLVVIGWHLGSAQAA